MKKNKRILLTTVAIITIVILLTIGCNAQQNNSVAKISNPTPTLSAYRELLDTEIRGIDAATIEGYLNGKGLGMALPAELNSYPGPRHVLDLADNLALSDEQEKQIQALFDEMQHQAIELGKQILTEEAQLEQSFRDKTIDESSLQMRLTKIGELQIQLRNVHLRTHLTTVDILSQHQIMLYNSLRGYRETPTDHQHDEQHN